MDKLTENSIKKAEINEKQYKIYDGGGMFLLIHPNGSKYWRMKYTFDGKSKLASFGVWPGVSLNEARKKLLPSLIILNKELKKKVRKFKNIVKVGRTHLQDATPITLGQEFSGYQSQLENCIKRIKNSLYEIYFLAQGGTAVGTGINTKKKF